MSSDSKNSYMWAWILFGFFLPLWIPIWAALSLDISFKEEYLTVFTLILSMTGYPAFKRIGDTIIFQKLDESFGNRFPNFWGWLLVFIPILLTSSLATLISIFTYSMPLWAVMSLGIFLGIVGSILLIIETTSSGV